MSTVTRELRLGCTFEIDDEPDMGYQTKTITIPNAGSIMPETTRTRVNNLNIVLGGGSISDTAQTAYANAMHEAFVVTTEEQIADAYDPYKLKKIHSATIVVKTEEVVYNG